MSTNIPAKNWDVVGYTLSNVLETQIILPARVVRLLYAQCTSANDVLISRQPNGTADPANRFTIKSGQALVLEDVALSPLDSAGTFFYARGGTNAVVLEVLYAEG